MQIARFPDERPPRWHKPVLALGNFDGLHRGHMKIIDRVRQRAGERGGTPAAMTFDPHPPRVLRPDKAPALLMTGEQRIEALRRSGMQGVAVVRFTRELSGWDPETFVRNVLVDWLQVVEVWVGANFLFGHERSGTFSVLRSLGARYGFRAEKIDPVRYKDFVVSSTRVRRLVSEGRVDEAGALLGHHYFIEGAIVRGAGRGRSIGVPTANLASENELVPPAGVYATLSTVKGVVTPSITNIGLRPTFGDVEHPVIETHLLDVDRDLYDARVRLSFVQRLRDERTFPDVDALKAQIEADVRSARRLFGRISLLNHRDMTNSAGVVQNGLVLRMSVPVSGEMASLGPELASRLAEQLGLPAGAAGSVGQAITDLSAEVGQSEADVEFEFLKREAMLEIVARSDGSTATRQVALHA
jgi:riboflavin kinase/FMN adenylyltransferase